MDFGLSEEQEMLQEMVRGFVSNECPPQRLRELFDAGLGNDSALWKGLAEMGLCGLVVPEEHGGAGMELLDLALVAEVLGAGGLPGPFLEHSLGCLAIALGGSDEQKRKYLPELAEGTRVGSVALCESGSAWEPDAWQVQYADGKLTGTKLYVPNAGQADLIIVGVAGGGLAVVEMSADGVSSENVEGIDRTRPVSTIVFDAAPADLLAEGEQAAVRVRDAGLVLLAADSFGAAVTLIDITVEYAKTREQFGMKIAQFQSVKHQLARLGTEVEPTRALYWYAAHACDHIPEEAEHAAALAKAHITDRAMNTARMAVELHGGLGFTWECDVQMWFKRAMFNRAFLGTPEALRERCATLSGW
jgi:alkylation response protein AidB-like acyl-CoA dehydrogenase